MAAKQRPAMSFPKSMPVPAASHADNADRPASRAGRKAITFYVDPSVWERTRILAIRQGRTTQAMLEELVTGYLAEHNAS